MIYKQKHKHIIRYLLLVREKRAPTARLEAIKRNVKQTKNMDEFERENMSTSGRSMD